MWHEIPTTINTPHMLWDKTNFELLDAHIACILASIKTNTWTVHVLVYSLMTCAEDC
jgi:hypothetical protein